jgi:hypothetical protein
MIHLRITSIIPLDDMIKFNNILNHLNFLTRKIIKIVDLWIKAIRE